MCSKRGQQPAKNGQFYRLAISSLKWQASILLPPICSHHCLLYSTTNTIEKYERTQQGYLLGITPKVSQNFPQWLLSRTGWRSEDGVRADLCSRKMETLLGSSGPSGRSQAPQRKPLPGWKVEKQRTLQRRPKLGPALGGVWLDGDTLTLVGRRVTSVSHVCKFCYIGVTSPMNLRNQSKYLYIWTHYCFFCQS